jgi:hypothetical protein
MRHDLYNEGDRRSGERMVHGTTYATGAESGAGRQRSPDATHLSGIHWSRTYPLSSPLYFRHRAALGGISVAAIKRFCGYRVGLQHSTLQTCDLTTGRKTAKPKFLAYAVVKNVTRLARTRNEINSFASLTQKAHADWHV